jgi:hypothetical protein
MGDFTAFDDDKNDMKLENSLEKNISSEVLKMPIFNFIAYIGQQISSIHYKTVL